MNNNWQVSAPWTDEQGPVNTSPGSQIRNDFEILKHSSEFGMTNNIHWIGLSRQEVANLRNLINSEELKKMLGSYGYKPGWGTKVNMMLEEDPNDAEFGLMIDSKEDIPQAFMSEIVNFVKNYRVQ